MNVGADETGDYPGHKEEVCCKGQQTICKMRISSEFRITIFEVIPKCILHHNMQLSECMSEALCKLTLGC